MHFTPESFDEFHDYFDNSLLDISTTAEWRDGDIPDHWFLIRKLLDVSFFIQTPIGIVANILAIIVAGELARMGDLTYSAATHLQAVAFWDFWSLIIDGFLDNMFAIMFFDLGAYNDLSCGVSTYLDWATSRAAILAVSISACDRCLSG